MDALMERADVEKKKKGENIMKVRISYINQLINQSINQSIRELLDQFYL